MDNTSIPSSTGDPGLDAKLDGLDDNLQPIGDNKGVIKWAIKSTAHAAT